MRIRVGTNFKSDDVPELEVVAGSNVAVTGTQTSAELVQVTISASGSGGGGTGLVLVPTAVKNSNYSAAAADFVPVSTQFGNVVVTLPTAPADNTVVGVKMVVQAGTNAITVAAGGSDVFNKVVGATTLTISQLNQGVIVQYNAALSVWYAIVDDYTIPALDTLGATSDITTRNASTSAHGLMPKLSNVVTQFFNGQGAQTVPVLDQLAAPSDITTLNATTSAHGLMPKGDGNAAHYYNGAGGLSTPAGSGGMAADPIWDSKGDLAAATGADAATKVSVGSNGQVLTADSTQTAGVKWATPVSGASTPWSTTLASGTSIGASSITVTTALPMMLANLSGTVFVVIDAWTPNAEAAIAAPDATGKILTLFRGGSTHLAHAHSAGASVVYMQVPEVSVDWWGAVPDSNPVWASGNVTAINACLTQLQFFGGRGYGFTVRASAGQYATNDQIVLPTQGLRKLMGLNLVCTSDLGSGKHAIDNTNQCAAILDNCAVTSSNSAMSMSSFLSGGSAPPVAMDGFHCTQRMALRDCGAVGFHAGYHLDFFDHATMDNCSAGNNMYSWFFNHAGQDGGDMKFTKCNGDGAYRAHWGAKAGGGGPSGVAWDNCSWVNAPFAWYCDGGISILDGTMTNCNTEFLGNGFMYAGGGITFWLNVVKPATTVSYTTGGTWNDPNFPTAAAVQSAGGTISVRDASFVATNPGGTNYVFDSPSGTVSFSNADIFTNTAGGPTGIVKTGGSGSTSGRLIAGNNRGSGFACVGTTGTVSAADLLEHNAVTGKQQRSQTAGAPPSGVAYPFFTPSGGTISTIDEGVTLVNCGSNTIAAAKYVKADLSDPGYIPGVLALGATGLFVLGETAFAQPCVNTVNGSTGVYTNTAGLTFSQTGIVGGGGATAVRFTAASLGFVNLISGGGGVPSLGDTFTIEAWLKLASVGAIQAIWSSQAGGAFLRINAAGNLEAVKQNTSIIVASTSALSADSIFHHLVWTKATATNKLYIDSVDVTGSVTNATIGGSNAFDIGKDETGGTSYLDGTMQFLAVYPTALTAGNVLANYTAGTTSTTGSSAGHVIQASAFSDGPIVGRTLAANASNQVKVKLTV